MGEIIIRKLNIIKSSKLLVLISFLVLGTSFICFNCSPEYVVYKVEYLKPDIRMNSQDAIDSLETIFEVQFDSSATDIVEDIYRRTKERKAFIVKLGMLSYEKARTDFVFNGLKNYLEFRRMIGDTLSKVTEEHLKIFIEQTEMIDLARYAPKFGLLTIYTEPAGADVYINRRDEERKTPVIKLSYRTGNHLLRLHKAKDFEDISDMVTVYENKETKRSYTFLKRKK